LESFFSHPLISRFSFRFPSVEDTIDVEATSFEVLESVYRVSPVSEGATTKRRRSLTLFAESSIAGAHRLVAACSGYAGREPSADTSRQKGMIHSRDFADPECNFVEIDIERFGDVKFDVTILAQLSAG